MQTITSNHASFIASEAIPNFRRVKIDAATRRVSLADEGDAFDGVSISMCQAAGDAVTVRFKTDPGTFEIEASGALVAGASLYDVDDGRVDDSDSGGSVGVLGVALTASMAAGDTVEVLFR